MALITRSVKTCALGPLCPLPPIAPAEARRTTTKKEQLWSQSSSVFSPSMLRHQGLPKSAEPGHSSHSSSSQYCPTSTFWRMHTGIYSLLQKHTKNYSLPQRTFGRFCNEFNSREIWRQTVTRPCGVHIQLCFVNLDSESECSCSATTPSNSVCARLVMASFLSPPPPPPNLQYTSFVNSITDTLTCLYAGTTPCMHEDQHAHRLHPDNDRTETVYPLGSHLILSLSAGMSPQGCCSPPPPHPHSHSCC